jgi:DUF305 family protein family protein
MSDSIHARGAVLLSLAFALSGPVTAAYAAGAADHGGHAVTSHVGGIAAEQPFLEENDAAMTKMMDGMTIKPSGDIDRDFVGMMAPHHQGAIDMAEAELRYGHNEQLRRIAQEIIVEQQQEILAMRIALGLPLPPPAAAPDQQTAVAPRAASPASSMQPSGKSTESMQMNMSMPMNHSKETK